MKKGVLKCLSLSLIFVILLSTLCVGAYAADNNVELVIKFDREEYIAGDIAYAYVYLNNIDDEADAGDLLQAFQAYISFDSDKLEMVDSYEYLYCEESGVVQTTNPVTGQDVIATYFYSEDGIDLSDEVFRGMLDLFEIEFKVKAPVGSGLELGFDSTYSIEAITKDVEKLYNVTATGDTVAVVPGEAIIAYHGDPAMDYIGYESTPIVWAEPQINVLRESGAVLIAKLYDIENNKVVAPIQVKTLKKGVNKFSSEPSSVNRFGYDSLEFYPVGDIYISDLEIQYFVWDSLGGMRCVAKSVVKGDFHRWSYPGIVE